MVAVHPESLSPSESRSQPRFAPGLIGLLVAILGLGTALVAPHVVAAVEPPRPKLSDTLAEAGDKFVGKMIDRVRHKEAPPSAEAAAPPRSLPLQ